jgi:hypothetical protein
MNATSMEYVYHKAQTEGEQLLSVLGYEIISGTHLNTLQRFLHAEPETQLLSALVLTIRGWLSILPHKEQFNGLNQSQTTTAAIGAMMGGESSQLSRNKR